MVSEYILKIATKIWEGGSDQFVETADITGLLQDLCIKTRVKTQVAGDSAPGIYCFSHPDIKAPEPGRVQQYQFPYFP